jgi:hypothetical protein
MNESYRANRLAAGIASLAFLYASSMRIHDFWSGAIVDAISATNALVYDFPMPFAEISRFTNL